MDWIIFRVIKKDSIFCFVQKVNFLTNRINEILQNYVRQYRHEIINSNTRERKKTSVLIPKWVDILSIHILFSPKKASLKTFKNRKLFNGSIWIQLMFLVSKFNYNILIGADELLN